jgi:hypothetical protein
MQSLNSEPATKNFEVIEGGRNKNQIAREREIECRMEHLSHNLELFINTLPAAMLADQSSTRELLEELAVKQCALQWIVRVAKHSESGVREKLCSDIDESLSRLEKTLDVLPRLQRIERHARLAAGSRRASGNSRSS